jgi:DMSO/TMAO reductase YedYZ heme-binding membrane subunit/nitrite reductase/ring-hydroxylating ferredoxin subunit
MSVGYTTVQWNGHKRLYDAFAAGAIAVFLGAYFAAGRWRWRGVEAVSDEVLLIRATGSCALVLLHVILCIGPLARLDRRFLPLLYNRRHLGVMTFLVALVHAAIVVGYYHGFGVVDPARSLLTSSADFLAWRAFPFEALGLGALVILFLMAATSHDFWLRNLGAPAWKRLHRLVYGAYAMLVGHVALGALQNERGVLGAALVAAGAATVGALHLLAGVREVRRDRGSPPAAAAGEEWIDVGPPERIPADRAVTVCAPGGERIAVFRRDTPGGSTVSAVTNVCAHQGGPLGEGKIIDGCITCPWHGWQYRPEDGRSPPPFTERIATHRVRIVGGRVQVSAKALPPGTPAGSVSVEGGDRDRR